MRQDVGFRPIHQRPDLREAFLKLIGDRTPLPAGVKLALLRKDRADQGGDHLRWPFGTWARAFRMKCTRQR